MSQKTKNILEWIACFVIAIVLALLIRFYIGTPTVVQQPSMYPTLKQGQRLILNRMVRTFHEVPERGDIITFEAPSNSYAHSVRAEYEDEPTNIFSSFVYYVLEIGKKSYIKRVIALPGEHVKIEVAMEILSMCMAIAISNNDNEMIDKISKLKQKVYQCDMRDIDEIIKKYGKQVKDVLEDIDE